MARAAAAKLGYPELKPQQQEVVVEFISGRDVFAVLPTGYGKSLCFGLLPIAYDLLEGCKERNAIVVVVSPLTAIMKDQVSYCWEGGTGFNQDQDLNFRCEHRQGGVVWL